MKKTYTKKQITEAIAYWEKQLKAGNYKRVDESVESMARLKMQQVKEKLAASAGQTPPKSALTRGDFCFLKIEKAERHGSPCLAIQTQTSRWINDGWRKIDPVGSVKRMEFREEDDWSSRYPEMVYLFPAEASVDDVKQLMQKSYRTKSVEADDGYLEEALSILRGHAVSEKTFAAVINIATKIKVKNEYAHQRAKKWKENQLFKIAFQKGMNDTFPCRYDGNQEYGQILAWMCKAAGCKTPSELYDQLVSSEREEHEGAQTAVDDWDEFYASEQDAVDQGSFLDSLVDRFDDFAEQHDDEDGVCLVDESDLESWLEETSRDIIDEAWQNFDYRDCQTRKGGRDIYY